MAERKDLTVRLAELPVSRDVQLGTAFVESAIGSMPMRTVLEREPGDDGIGEAAIKVELYQGTPGVFVRGTLRGSLEVGCSRCIEAVRIPVDDDIMVSFLPAADVPSDDDEADEEPAEDDVDLFPYEGEEINLTDLFRERLILAVPYAPLCQAECKGLCTACGNNLNAGECGCDRVPIDPRLAPLRDIVLKE